MRPAPAHADGNDDQRGAGALDRAGDGRNERDHRRHQHAANPDRVHCCLRSRGLPSL